MKITVAGVGYVGLSLAVLLAQKHNVTAITTTESKAEKLNQFISPIQDDEIERFFKEAREGKRELNLYTTTDKEAAYKSVSTAMRRYASEMEDSCSYALQRMNRCVDCDTETFDYMYRRLHEYKMF